MARGYTNRTPEKGERLLAKLSQGYSITAACNAESIGRKTYYDWRKSDPAFAASADEAIEAGTDLLEDAARRRAVAPANSSDTLLIFLLKSRRPEKYRERATIDINLQIRKKAEEMANALGISADTLIAEAEAVAAGTWDTWSPPS